MKDRQIRRDAEYSTEDYAWEAQIDLVLQEHDEYIQRIIEHSNALVREVEDLHRDVADLKRTVEMLIRQLYVQRKAEYYDKTTRP